MASTGTKDAARRVEAPSGAISGRRVLLPRLVVILLLLLYAASVGVSSLMALVLLAGGALILTLAILLVPDSALQSGRSGELAVEVVGSLLAPVLVFVFGGFVLQGSLLPLSPVVVVQVVVTAYTLPRAWQFPAQFWAVCGLFAAMWIRGETSLSAWVLQGLGAACLLGVAASVAKVQASRRSGERRSRADADVLHRVLAGALRVNSLEPNAVLTAVVDGLRSLGFSAVEIRRLDPVTGRARLVAGESSAGPLRDEVDVSPRLLADALAGGTLPTKMVAGEEVTSVEGSAGAVSTSMTLPMTFGDGGAGVLTATVASDELTTAQRGGVRALLDQAMAALRRAAEFEVDARVADDLRRLDERTQDFVSTASHELRTPLTVIAGLGQTLSGHWDDLDESRREDLLQRIEANAERLSAMVRSLLDTSALERGELEPAMASTDLRALIVRLLDRLATVTAAHPVSIDIPESLQIMVDPGLFEHVLENLLTNVAKHTPQGTAVVVGATALGEQVEVRVVDEGPGIPSDDLPHILDRFYRGGDPTRRPTGGLGLGLALAQQIVQAHGSELTVDSSGAGTTFRFSVPTA